MTTPDASSSRPQVGAGAVSLRKRIDLTCMASIAFAISTSACAAAQSVPAGALEVIARVNRAAAQLDYAALRADMAQEFRWSFGGDASAEQAVSEWQKRPDYMRQLGRVTKTPCAYLEDKSVECPAKGGTSFRAGFNLIEGQWKMVYFIAGD